MDDWSAYLNAMMDGQYFEAHEILEVRWRRTHGYRLKIAIWIAAAFVHWSRERPTGAIRLFARVLEDPQASELPIANLIASWITTLEKGRPICSPRLADVKEFIQWAQQDSEVASGFHISAL